MRKCRLLMFSTIFIGAFAFLMPSNASALTLDAEGLTVGIYDPGSELVFATAAGSVTFTGEIRNMQNVDPEFTAAGASGLAFDISPVTGDRRFAEMVFDFSVSSVTFIYGGNEGIFDIEARDIDGNVVDSFYQASTGAGEPAGPITLAGNIHSLYWFDLVTEPYMGTVAAIDNVEVQVPVPEPTTMLLLGTGLVGLVGFRRRFKKS